MEQYKYKINGKEYNVTVDEKEERFATVNVNGTDYEVEQEKKPEVIAPAPRPAAVSKPVAEPAPKANSAAGDGITIKSPLPGVVIAVSVKAGDIVKKGQPILVLEAMKMENEIVAEKDGKILTVAVSVGESVMEGADMIVIG